MRVLTVKQPGGHVTRTLLIVEDDDSLRAQLGDLLVEDGYDVVAAADLKRALDALGRTARPCVVLVDPLVPGLIVGDFSEALRDGDLLVVLPVVVAVAPGNKLPPARARLSRELVEPDALLDIVRECFADAA
jgi:CheY-like chemotaxis protein